jgi:hypothetical protein
MIRRNINFTKEQYEELRDEAHKRRSNLSAIIRELIDEHYKKDKHYLIAESEKYPGCYNIYDENGNQVHYFAEDDDKNYERALEWIKKKEKQKGL